MVQKKDGETGDVGLVQETSLTNSLHTYTYEGWSSIVVDLVQPKIDTIPFLGARAGPIVQAKLQSHFQNLSYLFSSPALKINFIVYCLGRANVKTICDLTQFKKTRVLHHLEQLGWSHSLDHATNLDDFLTNSFKAYLKEKGKFVPVKRLSIYYLSPHLEKFFKSLGSDIYHFFENDFVQRVLKEKKSFQNFCMKSNQGRIEGIKIKETNKQNSLNCLLCSKDLTSDNLKLFSGEKFCFSCYDNRGNDCFQKIKEVKNNGIQ